MGSGAAGAYAGWRALWRQQGAKLGVSDRRWMDRTGLICRTRAYQASMRNPLLGPTHLPPSPTCINRRGRGRPHLPHVRLPGLHAQPAAGPNSPPPLPHVY